MENITFLIGSLTGGGAERVTCNLANYLSNSYNVTVLTMSDVDDTYILNKNVKKEVLIKKTERKNKIYDFFIRFKRLKQYVLKNSNSNYVVMLPVTSLMILLLRKNIKGRLIVSERNYPLSYNVFIRFLLRTLSDRADGYVFQTEDASDWYKPKVKDYRIIPNAISEDFLNIELEACKRKKEIVAVGRLNKQKNFSLLIKAFSCISSEFEDYKLYIYGDGNEKEKLLSLINELNLNDKVFLKGYTKNIIDVLKDKCLYVLSSDFEGMPNSLIEAMALGLPCIATDCPCGGPRFLIKNNYNGLLIKVNNIEELEQAMKKMLINKEFSNELGNNARKIKEQLSPAQICSEWEKFIISGQKSERNI